MTYKVRVSFLELYNEDIIDLLNINNTNITIREDVIGNISWSGIHEQEVKESKDLLKYVILMFVKERERERVKK